MHGTQDDQSADQSAAPETPEAPEPKPVFSGDWNSASGAEKGRHSERVRQWRKREQARAEDEARRRMGAASEQPVSGIAPSTAALSPQPDATRAVLEGIRDDPQALASDRIRAASTLIALDRGEEQQAVDSDLVQLRAVLETLQPEERLAWLQGERLLAKAGA